jgi:IS1 family transposase
MIALRQTSFGHMRGRRRSVAYLRVSRESGEIVAYVRGKRDKKTAEKLKERIKRLGTSYDRAATDDRDSFVSIFGEDAHERGKEHTAGIEGNNCRLRRVFRRTCCFPKKLRNHWKVFTMTFFTSTIASSEINEKPRSKLLGIFVG